MRLIDADRLLQGFKDHEFIDTHIIWNAPTVDAIPIKWLEDRVRLHRQWDNDLRAFVIINEIECWRADNK